MIALLLILILGSCSKSEVVIMPPQTRGIDTCYTPRTRDTTRKEIKFDINIIEWENEDIAY